jgi:4a-hydroxytetrahydrobiopterin dehydratase
MNQWTELHNALHKTFEFSTFWDAMHWMQKASVEIDKLNHHPKWTNIYNRVEVQLTTHDAGNSVTAKDWELARILDAI